MKEQGNEHEIVEGIKDFILGGKAEFTIFQEPNIQAKYCVKRSDSRLGDTGNFGGCNIWFVSAELKEGQEVSTDTFVSSSNLVYQGYLKREYGSRDVIFQIGRKGLPDYNERSIKALLWVLSHSENIPSKVHIYHHGRCSACGRKLTDAMSLRCGLGPTCRKKIGLVN